MKVTVDVRGVSKVPSLVSAEYEEHKKLMIKLAKQFQLDHKTLAKEINLQLVNNQQIDVVLWDDYDPDVPVMFFEIKLKDDLVKSLNNHQLHKEMREYTEQAAKYDPPPTIYLLCGGYYDEIIYHRLIGLVTEKWGWVKIHMSTSPKKIIETMFGIMKNPDSPESELIPTLIRKGEKGFKNSIEAFMDGISEGLSVDIINWIYYGISLGEIEEKFYEYYGKHMNKKAKDFYEKLKKTYWRRRI